MTGDAAVAASCNWRASGMPVHPLTSCSSILIELFSAAGGQILNQVVFIIASGDVSSNFTFACYSTEIVTGEEL